MSRRTSSAFFAGSSRNACSRKSIRPFLIAQAEDASPVKTGMTTKDLGTQIRENKQQEKRQERQKTAFKLEKSQQKKPAEVIPLRGEKQEDYAFPDLSDLIFKEEEDD